MIINTLMRNYKWQERYLDLAEEISKWSKDPSTQVGACIVNTENKIVGIGYNGFPIGIDDNELSWSREGDFLNTKYPYVCHAEMNAIMNCTQLPKGYLCLVLLPTSYELNCLLGLRTCSPVRSLGFIAIGRCLFITAKLFSIPAKFVN